MDAPFDATVDLTRARERAYEVAAAWGLTLAAPFAMSNVSYVAPTTSGEVIKVPAGDDDESRHEGDALALWRGEGAVRLLRRDGEALLEERCEPGSDLAALPEEASLAVATALAPLLWRRARAPFRPVAPEVDRWIADAEREGYALAGLARSLFHELRPGADWVVHGDFHHHNVLRHHERYVAIDPKPYLADREYDVPSFLWNPMTNRLDDVERLERRVAAFVALGLDEYRIRAWTVIRGSYLRPDPVYEAPLRALVAS